MVKIFPHRFTSEELARYSKGETLGKIILSFLEEINGYGKSGFELTKIHQRRMLLTDCIEYKLEFKRLSFLKRLKLLF